jgi:hypothetical protein
MLKYYADADRYDREFNKMMSDEYNDGASPPAEKSNKLKADYEALLDKYPRAALYLKAQSQNENAHWADNTGKGAAGKKAMQMILDGASLEDAKTALAERRELVD